MPNASIGGLASGLDTATIISQLMQLEAVPQSRLQKRVSTEERQVTSLTTLNSKFASLAAKALELAKPDGWSPLTATSSNAKVSVSTDSTAGPVNLSLTVDEFARTTQVGFLDSHALGDTVATGSTIKINFTDPAVTDLDVPLGDGTLEGVITAINDPANATGFRATAVKVGTDQYRLLVESTTTGARTDATITQADGTALLGGGTVRSGLDAKISLGGGIVVTSTTNTFAGIVPGVTVTLAADAVKTSTSEIAVTRDTAKVTAAVKGLVDSINAATADIDSLTAYDATTKASGILAGESSLRGLRSELLNSIYPSDGTSLASLGIQVDRTGKLVFDEAKFKTAYDADPTGTAAKFTDATPLDLKDAPTGFADRVRKVADGASNTVNGTLTLAITGRNDGIKRLKDSIEQWDTRLELRRTALTRQFTALETAMGQMTSQSNWLAGQIGSLPSSSGS